MAIKVVFPAGTASISVSGLFQWDYGQVLEIESADIGSAIVEVHFACANMTEAIVRPCTFANGVGTVTIPDQCLEQQNTITAWVFEIDGTQGRTIKTINLSVTARKRPGKAHDFPSEHLDKYAELITEINEAVNAIENGQVKAAQAETADNAVYATTAGNAESATYATSAGQAASASHATQADNATKADRATKATTADKVKNVTSVAASCTISSGRGELPADVKSGEIYLVVLTTSSATHSGVFCWNSSSTQCWGALGDCDLGVQGTDVSISRNGTVTSALTGTLYFYELGGAS